MTLTADIDKVLNANTGDWLTICEIIERLGQTWNTNPAVTGMGLFRLNGEETFSRFAARMRGNGYTYPTVARELEQRGYASRIGYRFNQYTGDVFVLTWGPRCA